MTRRFGCSRNWTTGPKIRLSLENQPPPKQPPVFHRFLPVIFFFLSFLSNRSQPYLSNRPGVLLTPLSAASSQLSATSSSSMFSRSSAGWRFCPPLNYVSSKPRLTYIRGYFSRIEFGEKFNNNKIKKKKSYSFLWLRASSLVKAIPSKLQSRPPPL